MTQAKSHPKYSIGIDLGTTNCTAAYVELVDEQGTDPVIHILDIPQVVEPGTERSQSSLPSFVYHPLPAERQAGQFTVSWDEDRPFCVGEAAKARGQELPGRLISSAKSWLCQAGLDRRSAILPWGSEEVDAKMSPVDACRHYLEHLREVWEQSHPDAPLAEQRVLVTVPASFDPDARQLVQEACEAAGCADAVLLEEPQAAFYAWLHDHSAEWRKTLSVGDVVLVVDVGGGTSDFSLIQVKEQEGDLFLERLAVGEHLLLGGDNMDLAVAYHARMKLEEDGVDLDDWQFQCLVHAARRAKEELLSSDAPKETVELTVQGRGSRLVGGAVSVTVERDAVTSLLVDGFAPIVPADSTVTQTGQGMRQIGLAYAEDARVTSHLAAFLARSGPEAFPTHVLFNGGTFRAHALRARILEQMQAWAVAAERPAVLELLGGDLYAAVGRGASYYGLAREGRGIRIKGGTSRSYYIGVEDAVPAVPGLPRPLRAVCVVPFGMEEGSEAELKEEEFALLLGEPATFRFFSRSVPALSDGSEPTVGTIVRRWKTELTELHPVESHLDASEQDGKTVRVRLRSKVTELGVLELFCHATDGRSWKLEFDVRHEPEPALV